MRDIQDLDSYDVGESDIGTRIEVVCDRRSETDLIRKYKDYTALDYRVMGVDSAYKDSDTRLLRPSELLTRFVSLGNGERLVITGFSYYLRLWNGTDTSDFFRRFRDLLDSQKTGFILIVQKDVFVESVFSNPRYDRGRIVFLRSSYGYEPDSFSDTVALLDASSTPVSLIVDSYKELVRRICDPADDDRRIYGIENRGTRSAGLSRMVLWPKEPSEVLELLWGYRSDVPPDASSALLRCCVSENVPPNTLIEDRIGKVNMSPELIPQRLCQLSDDPIFPAILDHLRLVIPTDTFIRKALDSYSIGRDSFQHHYIVTAAIENIGMPDQVRLSSERRSGISHLDRKSSEAIITEFVSKAKDYSDATCWLNCGTDAERCDLIRRAGQYNLYGTFPEEISDIYPLIRDYIGSDFDYGENVLTDYFHRYRVNKIMNMVPPDFLLTVDTVKAKSIDVPTRRKELLRYKGDPDTALLVVDGMGAEYLPLLITLLRDRGLHIESAMTVKAEIPTITKMNPFEWKEENRLRDIKGVDNTAHDGAEKHVETTLEENIYASFQMIEDKVMASITENIGSFKRIIITADHGLTRLAARAKELGLAHTLDYEGDNWRYRDVTEDRRDPPANVDVEQKDGRYYWTIRNYDRFKKQSGVKYETHGGTSIEELMVPFIVVVRTASDAVEPIRKRTAHYSGDPSSQMKEDDSLDELFG